MGDILVKGATLADGKIEKLRVGLHGLAERTIDRDTAIALLRDGHSFIPLEGGVRGTALQLVEVSSEDWAIRRDNTPGDDSVGELPPA